MLTRISFSLRPSNVATRWFSYSESEVMVPVAVGQTVFTQNITWSSKFLPAITGVPQYPFFKSLKAQWDPHIYHGEILWNPALLPSWCRPIWPVKAMPWTHGSNMEVSRNGGIPIAGCFTRENPIKLGDLGVPLFQETTIWRFPEMGATLVIIYSRLGCSIINSPFLGTHMAMETPKWLAKDRGWSSRNGDVPGLSWV